MCPIHTLWDQYFAALPDGARPWVSISANKARDRLRLVLSKLHVPDWAEYGTHDFRRGHAEVRSIAYLPHICLCLRCCQDMRKSGCTLVQILLAGQWKSASFLKYLNEVRRALPLLTRRLAWLRPQADLEKDTAYAVAVESDEEVWIE
jgi:hypothetical protein